MDTKRPSFTVADITCERCGVMSGDRHVNEADHPWQGTLTAATAHIPTGPHPCCYHCGRGSLLPGPCPTPNRHPYMCVCQAAKKGSQP